MIELLTKTKKIALRCTLSKGVFSGERVFEVHCADGTRHKGVAGSMHCWDELGLPTKGNGPSKPIQGIVAALVVSLGEGRLLVSVPDDALIEVEESDVLERPKQQSEHVSV